eukprot:1157856-Pelagomonas_calceolata.AAC.2
MEVVGGCGVAKGDLVLGRGGGVVRGGVLGLRFGVGCGRGCAFGGGGVGGGCRPCWCSCR